MKSINNKKGMVGQLQGIAFGIIGLVILVGISLVVISHLEDTTAACPAACGTTGDYNISSDTCSNSTDADCGAAVGKAYTSLAYGATQIGSTGLLSWLPAIIALMVGVFFLAYFAGRRDY